MSTKYFRDFLAVLAGSTGPSVDEGARFPGPIPGGENRDFWVEPIGDWWSTQSPGGKPRVRAGSARDGRDSMLHLATVAARSNQPGGTPMRLSEILSRPGNPGHDAVPKRVVDGRTLPAIAATPPPTPRPPIAPRPRRPPKPWAKDTGNQPKRELPTGSPDESNSNDQ